MNRPLLAAVAAAAVAFALYYATLLPDFDFGDTGFFQTRVGSASLTPRDGYPLYFAIGNAFLWTTRLEPARALNLASAIEGAVACGLLVLVACELSGSLPAGVAAALTFAVSYTFWSQAIIAEVYALHAVFVALTTLLALRWAARPTLGRLVMFFAAYALGFGNHLSMILLLPGFAVFLLISAPGGWRTMLRPRVIALALMLAAAGALQYAWNFRGLWQWPNQPPALADAFRSFWFDVTKSDWRDTMVLRTPAAMSTDRLAMYRFDILQQFGWFVLLAPLGLIRLFAVDRRKAWLIALLYAANVAFAFTYNVGDTHVFYLPSHLFLALLIAPGIVFVGSIARARGVTVAIATVVLGGVAARAYHDFPALDRSEDRRPREVLSALTDGLDDRHAILLADLNWQQVNGLAYFGKNVRPDLAYAWMPHVLLYAPALIRDNLAAGRDVALTVRAQAALENAYGPLMPTAIDPRVATPSLTDVVRSIPRGMPYALCVIRPARGHALDRTVLNAIQILAGPEVVVGSADYAAVVGTAGNPPDLVVDSPVPFRRTIDVAGSTVEVRMESWVAFDTIRRMGFGQVVAAHHHTLIVERGVSFATFDRNGRATRTYYLANIFEREPRFRVRH